jgi:hypothetical protein
MGHVAIPAKTFARLFLPHAVSVTAPNNRKTKTDEATYEPQTFLNVPPEGKRAVLCPALG